MITCPNSHPFNPILYSAFVMDSMSPTTVQPYSNKAVENITTLLRCWKPNIMLKAVAYQVCTDSVLAPVIIFSEMYMYGTASTQVSYS